MDGKGKWAPWTPFLLLELQARFPCCLGGNHVKGKGLRLDLLEFKLDLGAGKLACLAMATCVHI